MLSITNVRIPLTQTDAGLGQRIAALLGVGQEQLTAVRMVRRAVDARHGRVQYCCTVEVSLSVDEQAVANRCGGDVRVVQEVLLPEPVPAGAPLGHRPVVVGAGPAGIFAAWQLAALGYRPLILERGPAVEQRIARVERFFSCGELDPEGNVLFGEGGAGTWSDGKLTARGRDPLGRRVLSLLVEAGAPEDILVDAHPHVGTDHLRAVTVRLRRIVEAMGGEYLFGTAVADIITRDGAVCAVILADGTRIDTDRVILATGHSARDTLTRLRDRGLAMEAKSFAVGLRVEHPQALIDRQQYGALAGYPGLGAAEYSLSMKVGDRSVYTFCMCPGGQVVNASSEAGCLCINGMSNHRRDGAQANAALVCSVGPADYGEGGALAGIAFQRRLEQAAFAASGDYRAPAQRVEDFIKNRPSRHFGDVVPTVRPGAVPADAGAVLPEAVSAALRRAFPALDRQLPGFAMADAVLTAVEARTSSPVRVLRGEDGQSLSCRGIYPVGEGAGYAGGIVSAAVDGLRAAAAVAGSGRPCGVKEG